MQYLIRLSTFVLIAGGLTSSLVAWADGTEDIVTNVDVNQYIEIHQGIGIPPNTEPEDIIGMMNAE